MSSIENMFKTVFEDESKVEVAVVAKTFGSILLFGEEHLDSFKNVKDKVTQGEWNALINAISSSFLSSVYVNAAKTNEEKAERMEVVTKATEGLLKGVGVA